MLQRLFQASAPILGRTFGIPTLVVIALLNECGAAEPKADASATQRSSGRGGALVIHVEGNADSVVLFDPQGRRDDEGPTHPAQEIPGCTRSGDVQEPESEAPVLLFELEDAVDGLYRVVAKVKAGEYLAVVGERTCGSGTVNSGDWRDRVKESGLHTWSIEVRRTSNGDSCWVKVKEVTRKSAQHPHKR